MGVAYHIPRGHTITMDFSQGHRVTGSLWTVTDCDPVATICTCTTPIRVTTPSHVGQPYMYFPHPVRTTTAKMYGWPRGLHVQEMVTPIPL